MRLFDKFLSRFKDPVQLELSSAEKIFREHKEQEITEAVQRAEQISEEATKKVKELEKTVDDIKQFQDDKNRSAVQDIADNLVKDRKQVINDFSISKNPHKNLEEIKKFMLDFQAMKRKEAAVLGIASKQKELGKHVKELQEIGEELENHLEKNYIIVDDAERIAKKQINIQEASETQKELENQIEEIELQELETKIFNYKERLDNHKQSSEMKDYERLNDKLQDKKHKKEDILQNFEQNASKMRRALKKLVYDAENKDLDLSYLDVLRNVRDAKIQEIIAQPDKVEKAMRQLDEKGDIADVQRQKLLEGAEHFSNLNNYVEKIQKIESEIQELENTIQTHKAPVKLKQLEQKIKESNERFEAEKDRKEELDEQINQIEEDVKHFEQDIHRIFNKNFKREVQFS